MRSLSATTYPHVVHAVQQLVQELEVLLEALFGAPDVRGVLLTPVRMAGDAHPVAGRVQAAPVLPIRAEHRRDPAGAARPPAEGQRRAAYGEPRPCGRRVLWITCAVEPKAVSVRSAGAGRGGDLDLDNRPGDADDAPPAEADGELKAALRHLVQEGLLVRAGEQNGHASPQPA